MYMEIQANFPGRIKGFLREKGQKLGLSAQKTPLEYFQRHSFDAVIAHFPQITAEELLPLAAKSLDPLGKHEHEHVAYYGGKHQHDGICLAIARGWVKEYASRSPEVSERLLHELEQLTPHQAE